MYILLLFSYIFCGLVRLKTGPPINPRIDMALWPWSLPYHRGIESAGGGGVMHTQGPPAWQIVNT